MKESLKYLKNIKTYCIDDMKIKYIVKKRNIKYPRLEFRTDILYVIIPKNFENENELLERESNWIKNKYLLIESVIPKDHKKDNFLLFGELFKLRKKPDFNSFLIDYKNREIVLGRNSIRSFIVYIKNFLRNKVKEYLKEFSNEKSFKKIYIRNQKTKWASCSSKENLNINFKLALLPNELIKYIVFHEILHLKEKKHNEWFRFQIKEKFPNYVNIEKELFKYWFWTEKILENLRTLQGV